MAANGAWDNGAMMDDDDDEDEDEDDEDTELENHDDDATPLGAETSIWRATQRLFRNDPTLRSVKLLFKTRSNLDRIMIRAFWQALEHTRAPLRAIHYEAWLYTHSGKKGFYCMMSALKNTQAPLEEVRLHPGSLDAKMLDTLFADFVWGSRVHTRVLDLRGIRFFIYTNQPPLHTVMQNKIEAYIKEQQLRNEVLERILLHIGQLAAHVLRPMLVRPVEFIHYPIESRS